MIHLYEVSKTGNSIKTESRLVAVKGWARGNEWLLVGMVFLSRLAKYSKMTQQ